MGEQQVSAKLGETVGVRPEIYLSATTTMLPPATTFGQVRCKIKGPSCGRLAMERHLMPFDAMNRGGITKLLHLIRVKRNVISLCVKIGTKCALVTDDQLVYHSLQCLSTICSPVAHV